MSPSVAPAEVYAVRLASVVRDAEDNFLHPTAHTGPMPLDFYLWVILRHDGVTVVDTGFSREAGRRRGRRLDLTPEEAVRGLGVDPDAVDQVVITHLHYDHAGNLDAFPRARIHIQQAEVTYATGPSMRHPELQHFYEGDDVANLVRAVHADRVTFHQGDVRIAPGVGLHLIGGHTLGMQAVSVRTERGDVVLAADAAHYAANLDLRNPFPSVADLTRMYDGFERILDLAPTRAHIIPGHDPGVLRAFPSAGAPRVEAAALHLPPVDLEHHAPVEERP